MDSGEAPTENQELPEKNDASRKTSPSPQEKAHASKTAQILDACGREDLEELRSLATSEGGLVSDEARRQAWPLLLGCAGSKVEEEEDPVSWKALPKHKDEYQVRLDVDRSFIYYPNDQSVKEITSRKVELSNLILETLRRQPHLHYFQGYHDICQVFLLVLGPQHRAAAVARLSALRIRDYMLPTLASSLAQLRLIPSIIAAVNMKLYHHLPLTQPFFAIPGIITMYAHDIQEYGDIAQVFDALLAREAVFSVYMFAQIVLERADELFEIPSDEPEMLHSILSKLPKPLNLASLIANTAKQIEQHPPESLRSWRTISSSSVLQTARRPDQILDQSLEDGKVYFETQVKELQWAERRDRVLATMWKYRRPARNIGLTVLVGILAIWLRRSSSLPSYPFLGSFWRYWSGYAGH